MTALDAVVADEGIVLVASCDGAQGRLLFVDTNIPLTPTVYLVQALAFKVFGSHFLVSRALICTVNALCVVMVFALALCFLPGRGAALAGALAIPFQICTLLLYTSDAADALLCVHVGGCRLLNK